jgi:hypothetical protein
MYSVPYYQWFHVTAVGIGTINSGYGGTIVFQLNLNKPRIYRNKGPIIIFVTFQIGFSASYLTGHNLCGTSALQLDVRLSWTMRGSTV